MLWRLAVALVVFAASCAAPEPPEGWAVERVTPDDETIDAADALCDDVREVALGALADETELGPIIDELARIGAMAGATAALPVLGTLQSDLDDTTGNAAGDTAADDSADEDRTAFVRRHDALVRAARAIDDATAAACEIPLFSALYATTGFPDCHFEMEIPIAAYTRLGDEGVCSPDGRPGFLPCWSIDGDHLAVDCASDEILMADGDRWVTADPPRTIAIDRTGVETDGPATIAATGATECAALTALFQDDELPNGVASDFDRLRDAAATLDDETRALVDDFIDANANPPSFDVFEVLVASLDDATASTCGFPIVSAWSSIVAPVAELPCWLETGSAYPAYRETECR